MSSEKVVPLYGDGTLRIITARVHLMRLAVDFVKDGKEGTRNERLRMASELSGIPLNLLKVETHQ